MIDILHSQVSLQFALCSSVNCSWRLPHATLHQESPQLVYAGDLESHDKSPLNRMCKRAFKPSGVNAKWTIGLEVSLMKQISIKRYTTNQIQQFKELSNTNMFGF